MAFVGQERLGVGGDFPIFTESTNSIINTNRLNEFLVSAGQASFFIKYIILLLSTLV